MAPQSKGKHVERPAISWRETSLEGSALILSVVKEAAAVAPIAELRKAATVALMILRTIQAVRENKEAYERLGDDSVGLITAIWRSYKKAEVPEEWLSSEMREILEDLTHTLESICSFVEDQLSRNRAIRVIFSRADVVKINEYREHLNYAMQKFELQSHMNINEVLMQLVRKNDQLSEQILYRNDEDIRRAQERAVQEARDHEVAAKLQEEDLKEELTLLAPKQGEIDHQAQDEQHDLEKMEKERTDMELELERLRATASAMELHRLKKAQQEEEIAKLKRKIAGEEDSRQSTTVSSNKKTSSRRNGGVVEEEEEERIGDVMIEEATSEEEEEVRRPARKNSKVKTNPSKSPKRRPVTSEDSTDDDQTDLHFLSSRMGSRRKLSSASLREEDLQSMRGSKMGTARRRPSSTSLRVESEDEFTDEEDEDYVIPPPRKSSKTKRKSHSASGSPSRDIGDLVAQVQGFNPYFPTYGPPFSPPYGYGMGIPGTVINSGVGNITNSTISNVGNNNSVRKVYRAPQTRSQRRAAGK